MRDAIELKLVDELGILRL